MYYLGEGCVLNPLLNTVESCFHCTLYNMFGKVRQCVECDQGGLIRCSSCDLLDSLPEVSG